MRITEFYIDFTAPLGTAALSPEQLDRAADRIEATARLGALLPPGAAADTAAVLRQICAKAVKSVGPSKRMQIKAEIADDIRLPPSDTARLGLIASELLANAVRHAHPTGVFGDIEVKCRREGGEVLLEVCDDGIGLPEHFDPYADSGRGLRVVRAVAEDLGASVRFNSGGCGLNAVVRAPGPR